MSPEVFDFVPIWTAILGFAVKDGQPMLAAGLKRLVLV